MDVITIKETEVVLLSPPYDFPPRPSIALSIFKACLEEDGITSTTLYPMFRMSELFGREMILAMYKMPPRAMCEEYLFSHLTGIKEPAGTKDTEEFVSYICSIKPELEQEFVSRLIRKGVDCAERITEETAQKIVSISPKVLAVSSVFYQLNASLAIIKRVKELSPEIKTMIGGPNCMGEAGVAILKFCPSVDAVFFGEGDEAFSEAIKALEDGTELPYGCLRLSDIEEHKEYEEDPPFRLTKDMNKIPIPDYGDFMPYLESVPEDIKSIFYMGYGPGLKPVLLTEGSRGCWWGQKKPCSFCGLNGLKNVYRIRTAERIYNELVTLNRRYDCYDFELTDNVIPTSYIKDLLPLLEKSGFRFFAEVKPFFSGADMLAFKRAGFINMQAGLETLNDHLLKLLNKGGNAANNIRFLKCYRRAGIKAYWNMLFKIPGEEREDYEEMISIIPLLFHLQPPTGYTEICFERRGAYVREQERFGLKMVPMPVYRFQFGNNEKAIQMFAQHYDEVGEEAERMRQETRPLYDKLTDIIKEWGRVYYRKNGCHLLMEDRMDYLVMTDTRPCAKMSLCFLKDHARTVSLICDTPKSFKQILKEVSDMGEGIDEEELTECIEFLLDKRYLIHISDQYLTLAIKKSRNQ